MIVARKICDALWRYLSRRDKDYIYSRRLVPATTSFRRTFTTFSGRDTIVYIDDIVVGEVTAICWNMTGKKQPRVTGTIWFCMFNENPIEKAPILNKQIRGETAKKTHINIEMKNQYGAQTNIIFYNVVGTKMIHGISVDDMTQEIQANFVADNVEFIARTTGDPIQAYNNQQQFGTITEPGLPGDEELGEITPADYIRLQVNSRNEGE